jgi:hypothetical protein
MTLEQDIIVEPGEDEMEAARSLIGVKGQATLVEVQHQPHCQWPTAIYHGTKYQLAAIKAKADGSPVGRPRKA